MRDAVIAAAQGCDAVFHNAAKAGAWGSYQSYHLANVVGTENVLAACRAHGIGRLVYTSTPSVTHRATHPVEGGTADTVPYGEGFKAPYATTKKIAELAVLAANDADAGDRRAAAAADLGRRRQPAAAAPGRARERRAAARSSATATTASTPPTSTTPRRRTSMRSSTSRRARPAPGARTSSATASRGPCARRSTACSARSARRWCTRRIPFGVAYAVGVVCEGLWHALPLQGEPPMTRFLAEQLATTHWYDMAPARRDFGYVPTGRLRRGPRRGCAAAPCSAAASIPRLSRRSESRPKPRRGTLHAREARSHGRAARMPA